VPERACKAGALPAELHAHSKSDLHSKAFLRAPKSIPSLFGESSDGSIRSIRPNGSICVRRAYAFRQELGGPIRSQIARGKIFSVGNLEVHDPLVRLPLQTSGGLTASDTAGLIGPDILRQFNITFDYGRQSIMFQKNHHYGKRSTFDRVGVWLGQNDANASAGFSVIDVVSGSPADGAGIKVGDKILAIDGTPAESLDLTEVRERFRSDPVGAKLRLQVQSGSEVRDVVLRLRDLV
jgi:hypothetical protein